MKKTLSYVLMFSLCFFSFFSTGCRSGGSGFKFLGAIVTGSIIAASGGSAAVFAANTRGAATEVKINDANAKLYVYELDKSATNLQGANKINGKSVKLENGELTFKLTAEEERLNIGEYLFVVKHTGADKPFLRAILSVLGNTNDISDMKISPTTEVTTQVYKAWVDKAPTNNSFVNFEANAKTDKTFVTKIEAKAKEYSDDLIEWSTKNDTDKQNDDISDVTVTEIDVPAEDLVKEPTKTEAVDTELAKKMPTTLQSYDWKPASASKLDEHRFSYAYVKNNSSWVKLNTIALSYYSGGLSFSGLTDEYQACDMHKIPTQLLEWLMTRVQNDEVTIPSYEDTPTNLNLPENSGPLMLKDVTFENDGKEMKFAVYHWPLYGGDLEFLRNEAHECAVAKNGKYTYLYLKNKDTTAAFGEIIFIHEPYE